MLVNNAAVVDPEGQSAVFGDPDWYDKVMEHIHVLSGALITPCRLRTFPQIVQSLAKQCALPVYFLSRVSTSPRCAEKRH